MAEMVSWAVLLCKFSDVEDEPNSVDYYQNLFTTAGSGAGSVVDYWRDVSHGNLDLSGTRVFGWLPLNKKRTDYSGSGINQAGRQDLVTWAKSAAAANHIDLSEFYGVIMVTNVSVDLFGSPRQLVVHAEVDHSLLTHEMGHGHGLSHSMDKDGVVYQDRWDIMSAANVFSFNHPVFGNSGPIVNAANMDLRGWLDPSRVWNGWDGSRRLHQTISLRPLVRPDLPGFLAAWIGGYLLEYRTVESWDSGLFRPGVLIHRLGNNSSFLIPGDGGRQDLQVGDMFTDGLRPFERYLRIKVVEMNPSDPQAVIELEAQPSDPVPPVGPGSIFGGVAVDGGGWLILNGKIIRVPPRSPVLELLQQISLLEMSDQIGSQELREQVEREAIANMVELTRRGLGRL